MRLSAPPSRPPGRSPGPSQRWRQEEVGILPMRAPGAERVRPEYRAPADPADLVVRDAFDAQRLREVIDSSRGDAMDIGLLNHREQRSLVSATRLKRTGKCRPAQGPLVRFGHRRGPSLW